MNSKEYVLSCKLIGEVYFVPYCLLILVILYSVIMRENVLVQNIILSTFENVIPLFSSWWSIYSLHELLEEDGGEVMFTYGVNKTHIGLLNNLRYFIWYIILWIAVMICIMQFILGEIFYLTMIQILFQSIFFWGFSFFTMALFKDVGWSFFVQFGYFFAAYFTNGNALGILNIFLYQEIDRNWKIISENSIKCIIFSILFLVVGNYFINKDLLRGIRNIGKK